MPLLSLIPLDQVAAAQLAADPAAFASRHQLTLAPHEDTVIGIAGATAEMLTKRPAPAPWIGYLALEGSARRLVGTCGFNGAPDATGTVEIAYFAFPGEEGRGVASAMAVALVQLASDARPSISGVCAHTLPERNASCRVLEKTGFRFVGPAIDPDDGPVWRWEQSIAGAD
jgi:RimJ/RimL family protein N-acetyltransferase